VRCLSQHRRLLLQHDGECPYFVNIVVECFDEYYERRSDKLSRLSRPHDVERLHLLIAGYVKSRMYRGDKSEARLFFQLAQNLLIYERYIMNSLKQPLLLQNYKHEALVTATREQWNLINNGLDRRNISAKWNTFQRFDVSCISVY
jgi:hypothetical protein